MTLGETEAEVTEGASITSRADAPLPRATLFRDGPVPLALTIAPDAGSGTGNEGSALGLPPGLAERLLEERLRRALLERADACAPEEAIRPLEAAPWVTV